VHGEADPLIYTLSELQGRVNTWKKDTKTIVFTNGCFDLLHQGHIDLITRAKSFGDYLIVGLNSDESVRQLKGKGRPVESEKIRAKNLLDLGLVAGIVVFAEETPLELIVGMRPDILVKGGDYFAEDIVGCKEVRSWGGRVEIIPLTQGYSTTKKINKMKR